MQWSIFNLKVILILSCIMMKNGQTNLLWKSSGIHTTRFLKFVWPVFFIMHGRVKWSEKSTLHSTCYFWILPNFQFYNEAYQWIFYKKGYCEKFSMILESTCNGVFLGWKWQQLKLVTYFKKWFHLNCLVLNIEKVLQASICWSFFEPYFSRKSMFHESVFLLSEIFGNIFCETENIKLQKARQLTIQTFIYCLDYLIYLIARKAFCKIMQYKGIWYVLY